METGRSARGCDILSDRMRPLAILCAALCLLLIPQVACAAADRSPHTSCLRPESTESAGSVEIPWRLVARSDAVVRARLNIPEDAMQLLQRREQKYASIGLAISTKFKRDRVGDLIQLKAYAAPLAGAPGAAALASLRNKDAILFLAHPYDPSTDAYYFAGNTRGALLSWSPDTENAVRREVDSQLGLARTVSDYLVRNTPAHDQEVAGLIDRAILPLTSAAAIGHLFSLGCDALPALVRHMDDRRLLPRQSFTISCAVPQCFEGPTHYAPIVVVDLVAIALDRISQESLGDIYNGGTEQQRRRTIEAWKVWLGRSLGL